MTLRLRLTRLCWCPSLPTGFWSPASSSSFLFFLSLRFFSFSFSFCSYPVLTMLLQSLASMLVALECVLRSPPQVYLDTTGYSFTLPVVKLLTRARTAAYIHYPTISTVRVCVCVLTHPVCLVLYRAVPCAEHDPEGAGEEAFLQQPVLCRRLRLDHECQAHVLLLLS